jgi:DNA-binding MarR family transcriptional regulator
VKREVQQVLDYYPRIFFACHVSHVKDPETGKELSDNQASILNHLDEFEPTRLTDLAAHMGVTASTMSISIDRLVRGGYVVKQRDREDARAVGLRLTAAGSRIRERDSVLDRGRVRDMLAMLSASERKRAIEGLALLARAGSELVYAKGRG